MKKICSGVTSKGLPCKNPLANNKLYCGKCKGAKPISIHNNSHSLSKARHQRLSETDQISLLIDKDNLNTIVEVEKKLFNKWVKKYKDSGRNSYSLQLEFLFDKIEEIRPSIRANYKDLRIPENYFMNLSIEDAELIYSRDKTAIIDPDFYDSVIRYNYKNNWSEVVSEWTGESISHEDIALDFIVDSKVSIIENENDPIAAQSLICEEMFKYYSNLDNGNRWERVWMEIDSDVPRDASSRKLKNMNLF